MQKACFSWRNVKKSKPLDFENAPSLREGMGWVLSQRFFNARRDICRAFHDDYASGPKSIDFGLWSAGAAGDDCAGVAHSLSWRRCETGDEADYRLCHRLDVLGSDLFVGAADLAAHHDSFRIGIRLEQRENVDEASSRHGVATDSHASGLAKAGSGQRVNSFVCQGAGSRNDPDRSRREDAGGRDTDLALADRKDSRAVWTEKTRLRRLYDIDSADLVLDRNAFRNADDEVDACIDRFEDTVGCEPGGNEYTRRVCARFVAGFANRVKDGNALDGLAALAGGDAAYHLSAVGEHLRGVKLAFPAGDPLDYDFSVFIYEDTHRRILTLATLKIENSDGDILILFGQVFSVLIGADIGHRIDKLPALCAEAIEGFLVGLIVLFAYDDLVLPDISHFFVLPS